MRYLLLLTLSSCSLLTTSLPSVPNVSPTPVASTKTTQVMAETTDTVFRWAWLSALLVFVFPSMRAPITGFLKAFFFILALPLELAHKHITMLYNKKYGGNRDA